MLRDTSYSRWFNHEVFSAHVMVVSFNLSHSATGQSEGQGHWHMNHISYSLSRVGILIPKIHTFFQADKIHLWSRRSWVTDCSQIETNDLLVKGGSKSQLIKLHSSWLSFVKYNLVFSYIYFSMMKLFFSLKTLVTTTRMQLNRVVNVCTPLESLQYILGS